MERISQSDFSKKTKVLRSLQPYPNGDSGLRVHSVKVVRYDGRYDLYVSHTPREYSHTDLHSIADVLEVGEKYPDYIRDGIHVACLNVGLVVTVTTLDDVYEIRISNK